MKSSWIITFIVAIVVGGVAFFVGIKYDQSKSTANTSDFSFNSQTGRTGQRGAAGRFGARVTVGQIISEDANSITIKLQDGSSKIINITTGTAINKMVPASIADLINGLRVAATGTNNSDGSINAQFIQINPMFRGGAQTQNATPSAAGQ